MLIESVEFIELIEAIERSLSELLTTIRELLAIAAAARPGAIKPASAKGIATILYANAQARFCLIIRKVRRAIRKARGISCG